MGGSSQYAKPKQQAFQGQGNLGNISYAPLEPLKVQSAGEEKIGEGIESATKNISGSLLGAIQANYMNDQKLKQFKQMYGGYNYMKPDVNMGGD